MASIAYRVKKLMKFQFRENVLSTIFRVDQIKLD